MFKRKASFFEMLSEIGYYRYEFVPVYPIIVSNANDFKDVTENRVLQKSNALIHHSKTL